MIRPTDDTSIREFAENIDISDVIRGLDLREQVQVRMPELDKEFDIIVESLQNRYMCSDFVGIPLYYE